MRRGVIGIKCHFTTWYVGHISVSVSMEALRMKVPLVSKYLSIIYFHLKSNDITQNAVNFKAKGEKWLEL